MSSPTNLVVIYAMSLAFIDHVMSSPNVLAKIDKNYRNFLNFLLLLFVSLLTMRCR
jgi:hypothetical protein